MEKEVADVLLIENEYLSRISSKCKNIINKYNIDTIYEIHSSFDVFNFAFIYFFVFLMFFWDNLWAFVFIPNIKLIKYHSTTSVSVFNYNEILNLV